MAEDARPIGYWLKLVDQLIDARFEEMLDEHGVTRRQWQLLSLLERGAVQRAELEQRLAPFLSGVGTTLDEELGELIESGWLTSDGDRLERTATGSGAFGRMAELVGEMRAGMTEGIGDDEYRQVLATLERLARNLGWTA